MELKEYFKIIKEYKAVFWLAVFLILTVSWGFFFLRPVSFTASLALNITRQGSQDTSDYKFDDFYRLQADEKFADTIVQWLKSPKTVAEIYSKSGINPEESSLRQLTRYFKPEKLSSQIVSVSFSTGSAEMAKKISAAISEIISKNINRLNESQKESTWFEIVPEEAVIIRNSSNPLVVLLLSLLIGIFVAFWIVMILHYIK